MNADERREKASKTLAIMLDYLGLEASIKSEMNDGNICLTVVSEQSGRIIGRKGQSLASLQLLVNRMMLQADEECPRIMVDVDGYSSERKSRASDAPPRRRAPQDGDRRRSPRGGEGRGDRRRDSRRDEGGWDNRRDERRGNDAPQNGGSDEDTLSRRALDAAKEVRRWGEPITLPAMNSHDRRLVHVALQDESDIATESVGDGNMKRVIISMKKD